jgi:DNA polymerase-3 subunit chi
MTEIRFYHLQRIALDRALPQLLEKTLERGWRAVVMAGSEDRVNALNGQLWTYANASFLPHGTRREGSPEMQPVWLTERDENPNDATVLFLVDGADSEQVETYDLCCDLFDGRDDAAVAQARDRWRDRKETGHKLTYWQQDESGRWEVKAEENAGTEPA